MDRLLEAEDIVWLYRGMIWHTVRDYCWQVCHMFAEYTTITHTHFFMGPKKTISDKKMAIYIYISRGPPNKTTIPNITKNRRYKPSQIGFPTLNQTIFGNWLQDTWICWRSSKNWEILRHQTTKMVNFIPCVLRRQTCMYFNISIIFYPHIYIYIDCVYVVIYKYTYTSHQFSCRCRKVNITKPEARKSKHIQSTAKRWRTGKRDK